MHISTVNLVPFPFVKRTFNLQKTPVENFSPNKTAYKIRQIFWMLFWTLHSAFVLEANLKQLKMGTKASLLALLN